MPIFNMKFSLSDEAVAIYDKLRGDIPREKFFRRALELGLCDVMETCSRMSRDYIGHSITGDNFDYKQARLALFSVQNPDDATPEKPQLIKSP